VRSSYADSFHFVWRAFALRSNQFCPWVVAERPATIAACSILGNRKQLAIG